MSRMLELSEPVYRALLRAANARGIAPEEWVVERLPRLESERPTSVPPEVRDLLWRHIITTGDPTPIDNEQIDADLARAYDDSHEPEPVDLTKSSI